STRKLELRLNNITATSATPCRTSATENLVNLPELKIVDNILKATLAPGCVTTFVTTVTQIQ
ncbi:MAG: hypothetical protein GYA71_10280, partial [Bacteroidales bacterium]|nr:hypothetical protein [Bacteroidales bacterium]